MLKTAGLSKTFKNAAEPALSDINLEITEGEFICIVGPSGCGKSTLLNLIAGLETPTAGSIILDDKEVKGPGADRVVMFQEPALYPWLNVIDNVHEAAYGSCQSSYHGQQDNAYGRTFFGS